MMRIVDVILTNPAKLEIPNKGPTLAEACPNGPSVMTWFPTFAPDGL